MPLLFPSHFLLILTFNSQMAIAIKKSQLRGFIQSMFDEGIVNNQFYQLQAMKEALRRDYAVRAVTSYCISCHNLFCTLTEQIYQQNVDFPKVHVIARELYARSSGFGAENVRRACAEILHACEGKDKNNCSQALYWTKNEFSYLRRKLETLVQGIVNDQFNRIHSLKRTGEPDCVVKLIEAYFGDVDTIISELSRHADESNVDFSKLTALAHEIEDKSTSIGAEHVRLACADLIQACDKRHKNFARSLMWVRNEFTHTRNKLESYVQMERRIIRLVNAQAQSSS